MSQKTYMERVEDVLEAMGVRTFEPPMTLDYRFGKFNAVEGIFRCFVRMEDIERTLGYLEIKGDQVYFVTLQYPGYDGLMTEIESIARKSRKILGRHFAVEFILAVGEELNEDKEKILATFAGFTASREPGVYCSLKIWDEEGLQDAEKRWFHSIPSQ